MQSREISVPGLAWGSLYLLGIMTQSWSSEDFSEGTLARSADEDFWDPILQTPAPTSQTSSAENEVFRFFPDPLVRGPIKLLTQGPGYWDPDDFNGTENRAVNVSDPWEAPLSTAASRPANVGGNSDFWDPAPISAHRNTQRYRGVVREYPASAIRPLCIGKALFELLSTNSGKLGREASSLDA
jgi:hypothetical protein